MKVIAYCLSLAASLAGASAASAGTSTSTGTASMNVIAQCEVTGATVNLGAYKATDTVQNVAEQVGWFFYPGYGYTAGSSGIGTANLGTVTCSSGTPFTVTMAGTGFLDSVEIALPSGKIGMFPTIKKIGDTVLPSGGSWMGGLGKEAGPNSEPVDGVLPGAIATGAAQPIMGNTTILYQNTASNGYAAADMQLGVSGQYSGTWVTTLNF